MKNKEISKKVRKSNIGRKKTEEEILKLKASCKGINSGKNNGMYGVTGKDHPCFGKPKSREHKKKLSESATRNDYSGKNNPMYGKNHSRQSIEKMRKVKFGITWEERQGSKKSQLRKQKASERMSGKGHHNWRGGCTSDGYCEEWRTKDLKEHILERDNYTCQNPQCLGVTKRILVHHINYNKKDCDPWNLLILCFSCNSIANYYREWWEAFYKEIIRRMGIYDTNRNY